MIAGQISAVLKFVLGYLTDADSGLAPEVLREPRLPRQMVRWLDFLAGI